MTPKTIVVLPTYNERENIGGIINKILGLKIKNLSILIVDDNSPDGTWEIAQELSKKQPRLNLLLRKGKRGRGLAGIEGFRYCLNHGADVIIEMDADFSHDPQYIPLFLEKIKKYDLVLGSRAVKGGKDVGRSFFRRLITKLANSYTRITLGMRIRDCNSGYRCFRRKVLESINLGNIVSEGPSIVQEILYEAYTKRFNIAEVPIIFRNRTMGKTKLRNKDLIISYITIPRLRRKND
ncbi:polyprenol monophosphomannose synthase [Candidatus Woesearchaeota archaeon]|nr:polyprenol monophosphomannose synthase [Candidatus Woesearchaeota archaeon]